VHSWETSTANIIVIIAGNPRGLISSHHEKLVLVDGECADGNAVAFIGVCEARSAHCGNAEIV